MSVFTLDLDETEREALEAHRIRLGCRSGAETIRSLLLAKPEMVAFARSAEKAYIGQRLHGETVPTLSRPAFNPQPKKKSKP